MNDYLKYLQVLAEKHGMEKPCRVAFQEGRNNDDILIRFLQPMDKNRLLLEEER
ncbi:MAG TPA: hypothetical protein VI278_14645 [Nitrososphaeraceae archaeon]